MHSAQPPRIVTDLRNRLDAAVIGQVPLKDCLVLALIAKEHVYVEGPPGAAKPLLAETAARWPSRRTQPGQPATPAARRPYRCTYTGLGLPSCSLRVPYCCIICLIYGSTYVGTQPAWVTMSAARAFAFG